MSGLKKAVNLFIKIIRHILSIFIIVLSIGVFSFSAFAGILVLLSGILCSPFSGKLITKISGKKIKGGFIALGVAVLFFTGFAITPTAGGSENSQTVETSINEEKVVKAAETQTPVLSQIPTSELLETPAVGLTEKPTAIPTRKPTVVPTQVSATTPTASPTQTPEVIPTQAPTQTPTVVPTEIPTQMPTAEPTQEPASSSDAEVAQKTEAAATDKLTGGQSVNDNTEITNANGISNISDSGGNDGDKFGDAIAQGVYIGNRKNHKLHVSSCHTLPKEENQVVFNSLEEAESAGYTDYCGNCMK